MCVLCNDENLNPVTNRQRCKVGLLYISQDEASQNSISIQANLKNISRSYKGLIRKEEKLSISFLFLIYEDDLHDFLDRIPRSSQNFLLESFNRHDFGHGLMSGLNALGVR